MKKILVLVLVVAVAIAAVVTCPDKKAHVEAVSNTLTSMVDEKLNESMPAAGKAWSFVGTMFAGKIIDTVLEQKIEIDNYFVYSVGRITFRGETKTVSVGVFNHVFTFDKEDLKNAITE